MTARLSIVVAVHGASAGLGHVLDRLCEPNRAEVEILVCAGRDWPVVERLCAGRAGVHAVRGEESALTPHLWRDGILKASAPAVAITIAQHLPAKDWVDRLLAQDLETYCAVGGAIDIEPGAAASSWAPYLLRYARYGPEGEAREVDDVAGDNAVYDRGALLAHQGAFADGFWEPELHARLRAEGRRILFDPALIVVQQRHLGVLDFARQRFSHGTRFGLDRARKMSAGMRIVYVLAAPAAPFVLGAKVCARTWRSLRLRPHLIRSLPLLMVLLLAWGAGETRGAATALRGGGSS